MSDMKEEIINIYKKHNKLGFFVTMSLNSPVKLECYGFSESDTYGIMQSLLEHYDDNLQDQHATNFNALHYEEDKEGLMNLIMKNIKNERG